MRFLDFATRSSGASLSFNEWAQFFNLQNTLGNPFFSDLTRGTLGAKQEEIQATFQGLVDGAYKSNGTVFACELARISLFSEARFKYRRLVNGRPGSMFGTKDLAILDTPEPGKTTGSLLTRCLLDADFGGNYFGARRGPNRLVRLRPDWVTIILGSLNDPDVGFGDLDAEVLGYIYTPGGPHSGKKSVSLFPEEVVHYAPLPDPLAMFRGMSWLTPIIREVMGDEAATTHKLKYFENGATPNLVISFDANIQREQFEAWMKLFDERYEGTANAYKTLYLGAGAKAEAVGDDLKNIDFRAVQQAGENRIANAAGVPGIIAGLAEGLKAATLANYAEARRHFTDATIRPLWREAAGSFSRVVPVPNGTELWYDDRDIPYLQADRKDAAEVQQAEATTIKTLIEAGYEPDSAAAAVAAEDMSLLKHTGRVSVQLYEPGEGPKGPSSSSGE